MLRAGNNRRGNRVPRAQGVLPFKKDFSPKSLDMVKHSVTRRRHRSVRPSLDVILTLRDVIAFLLVVTPPSMTNAFQLEAILTSQTSQDIQDRHHHYIYDKSFVPLTLHDYFTITKDSSLKNTPEK